MTYYINNKPKIPNITNADEEYQQKHAMYSSNLNEQLAQYVQNMQALRVSSARALSKAHYYESLQRMETEMNNVKKAYDDEMTRTRQDLQDTVDKNIALSQALLRDKEKLEELEKRLTYDESAISAAHGYEGDLRHVLSRRQAEVIRMKDEVKITNDRYTLLKEERDLLLKTKEDLLKRLDEETQKRKELENRMANLQQHKDFQNKLHSQTESDLQERLKIANSIIQMLDDKLKELGHMTQEQLPQMLKQMQDTTANEMKEFHAETEERLGKTINSLKRQMIEEQKNKIKAEKDKELLLRVNLNQEEAEKDIKAQNQALASQLQTVKKELENEKIRAHIKAVEQAEAVKNLEDDLIEKTQDFIQAREAQAKLKAELETYKNMLHEENKRIKNDRIPNITLSKLPQVPSSPTSPNTPAKSPIKPSSLPIVPPGDPFRPGYQRAKSPRLPPIQGKSNMGGILNEYKKPDYFNSFVSKSTSRLPWSTYETTYGKSFSPKPHNKYGNSHGYTYK